MRSGWSRFRHSDRDPIDGPALENATQDTFRFAEIGQLSSPWGEENLDHKTVFP
jgi:hypothetical protein